jgi:peptidoglycan L-alanyl-D-glutamate endopeptidase CwlK
LSNRSATRLKGVHPDLVSVIRLGLAKSEIDFTVTEGVRTTERQSRLVAEGKSQTMNSRHLLQSDGFGHAVDVVALDGGEASWEFSDYEKIAKAMKAAADELGVSITWGGDWKSFRDGPHFQLER